MWEKKYYNIEIHNYSNRVYLHSYYSICVNIHIYTLANTIEFWAILCKFYNFLYFALIDVSALMNVCNILIIFSHINKIHSFTHADSRNIWKWGCLHLLYKIWSKIWLDCRPGSSLKWWDKLCRRLVVGWKANID